ncbi:uncharacterized protein LOC125032720 [Penaeus chinensis]|uniref:uncharacterized protein LOC125032720 n=1 Tax=Penaeus chinensis TaxID=139456 RepID=UPI001FB80843|nr:uncharacterized protein LOC125032720 [Penaeus chinensis]XP_047479969.1 uncharacterized protein LOC125032720 [Penaeus chinensis]
MAVKFASCLTIILSLTLTSCFPANGPALLARRLPDNDFHLLAILQIHDERYHTLTYKRLWEISTPSSFSEAIPESERRDGDASRSLLPGVTLFPVANNSLVPLIAKDTASQISEVYKSRSLEKSDKVVTKNPDEIDAYVTDGNPKQNDEVYFFWTWEAVVIVSIPVLCISSLLIISFLTRTRLGVRLYRFLTSKHKFDLEISRRISQQLEQPHVFRSAEATTDQGEPRNGEENGECVAVELRYNSSSESFVPYYDSLESRDSFDSQYSSEGSRPDNYVGSSRSTREQRSAGRKSSASSEASSVIYHSTSRRGSQESQRSLPKLWGGRRKGSNDSQMSLDSQLSVHRRGSTESQRSIMKLWYARRKGSTDSQISSDSQSIASRRGSSDSQRRQISTDRHSSMDSSYGSLDSQGSKEGLDNVGTGARTKRRDSPRQLEASLQEMTTYSQAKARSLDLGEERRSPRTLSLIHEEPPV